jgi:hypothetical protein
MGGGGLDRGHGGKEFTSDQPVRPDLGALA